MRKPTIAVDIDDVLADENGGMLEFINDKYGLNLTLEDYDIEAPYWGYWEKVWGVSDEEGAERFQAYLDSGIKESHEVIPGAIETMGALQKRFELVIITSRSDQVIELTHRWLERHFPSVFKAVEFVVVWSKDKKSSKAEIAQSLDAKYLIDDNAEHCRLAQEAGVQAILFGDYGWNRAEHVPDAVIRCKDWVAVGEYFDGIA